MCRPLLICMDQFLSHNRVSLGLLLASAAYIRELDDRYGSPGFLAALDAGSRGNEHRLTTGCPLPDGTQAYVASLAPLIRGLLDSRSREVPAVDPITVRSAD
jgi:hypothetical protein